MNADPMTTGWYYAKQGAPPGQQTGPLTWEELYALAQSGALAPADLVWNAGLPGWLTAAQIAGLFPGLAAPAPSAYPGVGQPSPARGKAPQVSWPQGAQPGRGHSRLYWAIPLVVLALVAVALGLYFGLRDGVGAGSTASIRATTTTTIPTTTTTEAPRTWTKLDPAGDVPAGRMGYSMVYDSDTGKAILFSGWSVANSNNLADTWAYDPAANTWTDLEPDGDVPAGRNGHSMVHDSDTGKVILFGGWDGRVDLADTWAYDPATNTWTDLDPGGDVPSARSTHCMVYDSNTKRVILFGGHQSRGESSDTYFNDTWAYDPAANTWTELDPGGDVPAARANHSMVYDPDSGQVILFGGRQSGGESSDTYSNDTWAYDPATNTWTDLDPGGDVPSARSCHCMVYESGTGRAILFGGSVSGTILADTWAYDPAANSWTELDSGADAPSGGLSSCMVYDPATGKLILFGGWDSKTSLDETWVFGHQRD